MAVYHYRLGYLIFLIEVVAEGRRIPDGVDRAADAA